MCAVFFFRGEIFLCLSSLSFFPLSFFFSLSLCLSVSLCMTLFLWWVGGWVGWVTAAGLQRSTEPEAVRGADHAHREPHGRSHHEGPLGRGRDQGAAGIGGDCRRLHQVREGGRERGRDGWRDGRGILSVLDGCQRSCRQL